MDDSYLLILYIGNRQRGAAFQHACGLRNWAVATPENDEAALTMTTNYEPDLIILDTTKSDQDAHLYHRIREASSAPILVLTSTPESYSGVRTLRRRAPYAALFRAVRELTGENKNGYEQRPYPFGLVQ